MKRIFYLFLIFTVLTLFINCAGKERLGSAKKVYVIGEYNQSIKTFKRAYKKEKNQYYKGEASFYIAESYRLLNQPQKALQEYTRAINAGYPDRKAKLYKAQSLLKLGKYDEAAPLFEEYLEEVRGDRLAFNGLASAKLGMDPPPAELYEINIVKKLNSKYSDYCPMLAPDDQYMIYFSSMRRANNKKNKNISKITGQGSSVIYVAYEEAKGNWKDIEPIFEKKETDNETDKEKEYFEDGVISLTPDGKEAFFTRTRYDKTCPMGSEIWNVKKAGGKWSEPVKIVLGEDSIIFAHPSISPDGNTLYYVSDLAGGFGGKDIWKSVKMNDGWSPPINLGIDINTPGDEMFPFIKQDSLLYFSSDGHVGYGGLDIFIAKQIDEKRWEVTNMGQPVNSSSDDFGITFYPNKDAGFFSSSRGNNKGYENIYHFERPVIQVVLSGLISAGKDIPVPPKTVARIIGTDGINMRIDVESSGTFNIMLNPNAEYLVLVTAPGYFNHKDKLNTKGVRESRQYNLNINLQTIEHPLYFENIKFEAGSWELSKTTKTELDKVVSLLKNNPSVKIDVISHTDAKGDENENTELSKKRAESVRQYIVSQEISPDRLAAIGLGSKQPLKVDQNLTKKYNFLKPGDELTEDFIKRLMQRDQTTARNLNNRVEFNVRKE